MSFFELKNGVWECDITFNSFQSAAEKDFWDNGEISKDKVMQYLLVGGFGNGKSLWTTFTTHRMCLKYPGTQWLFIKNVSKDLETTAITQMIKDFGVTNTFKYNKKDKTFTYKNGSKIQFTGLDNNNVGGLLSSQWDGFTFNQIEEIDEDVYLHVFGRRRGNMDRKIVLLIEGNPAPGWVKRRFVDKPIDEYTKFYSSSTHVNAHNLPDDYIPGMVRVLGQEKIDRYMKGSWELNDIKVFHQFDEFQNVIPSHEIDSDSIIYVGFDHGVVHASAFIWIALNKKGEIHVFDEFYEKKASTLQLRAAATRWGKYPIVADYAIKRVERDGRCLWDDLVQDGLRLQESNKDKLGNIRIINDGFLNKKLFIHDNCTNLIREINNYQWKVNSAGAVNKTYETPVKKDDDALDAFMYVYREMVDRNPPEQNEAQKRLAEKFNLMRNSSMKRRYC